MHYTVLGILQVRILEWVAFPFSRWSSQPRDRTQVSHIAGRFFISWVTGKTLENKTSSPKLWIKRGKNAVSENILYYPIMVERKAMTNLAVVQWLSHVRLFVTHEQQHTRLSCPSPPEACWNSSPLSQWCHPTISSSVIPFSSCLQSFPESGSFLMTQLITSGGQSFGASALASGLSMNIQGWFPLGLTGWISLQS